MKVYITSSGHYSDWMITGVFSSMQKAQEYIDTMSVVDDYTNDTIDEYEVDSAAKPEYAAILIYPDVDKFIIENYEDYQSFFNDGDVFHKDAIKSIPESREHYIVRVNFNLNNKVMIKAAHDKIAEYKAMEEGV